VIRALPYADLHMSRSTHSDEHLKLALDMPAIWISGTTPALSLREALTMTAQRHSADGRSPAVIKGPQGVVIDHDQMLRLWAALGLMWSS
jgi:hypothetical protein